MATAFRLVVAAVLCSNAAHMAQPLKDVLDWEDFQAALVEDGSDEGYSLLQSKVNMKRADWSPPTLPMEQSQDSREESMDSISPEDFAETMSEESVPQAVSLIQTDAHIERASIHSSTKAVVANADGTFALERKAVIPQDGIVHMSIGGDGSYLWEGASEGISLIQTDASLKIDAASEQDKTDLDVKANANLAKSSVDAGHDKNVEEISLLQTERKMEAMVTNADGSIAKESTVPLVHDDGMVQISVGADGSSEAISLIQKDASLQTEVAKETLELELHERGTSSESSAEGAPAVEAAPEGLSLLQKDAHVTRAMITEADGSIVMDTETAIPRDGIVHMSIGASGMSHFEV